MLNEWRTIVIREIVIECCSLLLWISCYWYASVSHSLSLSPSVYGCACVRVDQSLCYTRRACVCVLSVCAHTTSICVIYVWLTGAVVFVVVSVRFYTRWAQVYSTRIFSIFILSFTMCRLNKCVCARMCMHISLILYSFRFIIRDYKIHLFIFLIFNSNRHYRTLCERFNNDMKNVCYSKSLHSLWIQQWKR